MEKTIRFDYQPSLAFFKEREMTRMGEQAETAKKELLTREGLGNDFLGWIDLPVDYDKEEFKRIQEAAKRIQEDSEVLVVIGIGGSYLGARAAIEFLTPSFNNQLSKEDRKGAPEIYFAGNSISASYLNDLIKIIGDRDFSVNVISKSGTTTEPAIAFRIFKKMLEEKYGKEGAAKRIYATTDRARGALRSMADKEGYETFIIPDDVGGRFTVLTPVGLLPIAAAGCDIEALMKGAQAQRDIALNKPYAENPSLQYAAARNLLLRKGKVMEVLINYEPSLNMVSEWWKQLYGESEGKDLRGLYPASANFSTDLHSLGQFIQDGSRIMFETVMNVENPPSDVVIDKEPEDLDGINYLSGKGFNFVNKNAMLGTRLAHIEGQVPQLVVDIDEQDAFCLGSLFYFFEFAVGVSGYMLGINPFDQPGVEAYKKNMFGLLGKPGFEELGEELKKKL